jgi:response regulator RpfG family c-di-GMP phosphodiesterase
MAIIIHRIRSIARIAGEEQSSRLDELLRRSPMTARALLEERSPRSIALALAVLMDELEIESMEHSRRLAARMMLMADELGLSARVRESWHDAALVHDVGKLAICDSTINGSHALSPAELDLIHLHSSLGHAVLSGIAGLEEAATMVLHHHEYWDGSGYPDARVATRIPRSARVFALVDSYDAMVRSDRAFRDPVSHERACDEILTLSGQRYDPLVVEAFARVRDGAWLEVVDEERSDSPPALAIMQS